MKGKTERSGVFLGFADWTMERGNHTVGEMDRLMQAACRSKYPCSRPCTYEEFINSAIAGLPLLNETRYDLTFVGPGSELVGPGALDNSHTLGQRKKVVRPGGRLDGSSGTFELDEGSSWGRKTCILKALVHGFYILSII